MTSIRSRSGPARGGASSFRPAPPHKWRRRAPFVRTGGRQGGRPAHVTSAAKPRAGGGGASGKLRAPAHPGESRPFPAPRRRPPRSPARRRTKGGLGSPPPPPRSFQFVAARPAPRPPAVQRRGRERGAARCSARARPRGCPLRQRLPAATLLRPHSLKGNGARGRRPLARPTEAPGRKQPWQTRGREPGLRGGRTRWGHRRMSPARGTPRSKPKHYESHRASQQRPPAVCSAHAYGLWI